MRIKLFFFLFLSILIGSAKANTPKQHPHVFFHKENISDQIKQIEISVLENTVILKNIPDTCRMQIFSIIGVKVIDIEIKKGNSEIPINLPRGYYIVRINDVVRKIAIR